MLGVQLEMFCIHEHQKNNKKRRVKGGWAIAQSPILGTTITLKRLKCLSTKYFSKIKFSGHSICPLKNNKNAK
jgi:hypothetical protein